MMVSYVKKFVLKMTLNPYNCLIGSAAGLKTASTSMAFSFRTAVAGLPPAQPLVRGRHSRLGRIAGRINAQAPALTTEIQGPKDANALITPYTMGPFQLEHRVVMAPLTRCRALGEPACDRTSLGHPKLGAVTCIMYWRHLLVYTSETHATHALSIGRIV